MVQEGRAAERYSSADEEYVRFLTETAMERDSIIFKPWALGHVEPRHAWEARVVRLAQNQFGGKPRQIYDDLQSALKKRREENKHKYSARIPVLFLAFYVLILKKFFAMFIIRPWLRWKHVGFKRRPSSIASEPSTGHTSSELKASIVVLSFNRLSYLQTTLESLAATTNRQDFELIVVDNGSVDGSADELRALANRGFIDKLILQKENLGTSGGFNVGFAFASPASRYLMKLDSDIMLLTPGWLDRIDSFYRMNSKIGLVALKLVNHTAHMLSPVDVVGSDKVISWNYWVAGGACMTIPRALFDRLGYFCEDFEIKYMPDDIDYAVRVNLLGLRSFYLCDAVSYHRQDLDQDYAKRLSDQKKEELSASRKKEKEIYSQYVLGERDLRILYPHYEKLEFPTGTNILERG